MCGDHLIVLVPLIRHARLLLCSDRYRASVIIKRLFSVFDVNGDGVVDFLELSSGLSVLCGGPEAEKIRAHFNLFDANADGCISFDEMSSYLTAVYKVWSSVLRSCHLRRQRADGVFNALFRCCWSRRRSCAPRWI